MTPRSAVPPWLVVASWVMAALFLFAVVVQYNDPDPLVWVAVYGAAALLSVAAARGRSLPYLAAGIALLCSVWGVLLVPRFFGSTTLREIFADVGMKSAATEYAREAIGLWLVAAWLVLLAWRGWRQP